MRTTSSAVGGVIDMETGFDFDPFIATATDLVDAIAAEAGNSYSSTTLELIERWLAAHFAAIHTRIAQRQEIGAAEQEAAMNVGRGLDLTEWGQMAQVLDRDGFLSTLSKKRKVAAVYWLGEEVPERSNVTDSEA